MPVSGDTSPFSSSTTSNWVAKAGGLPDRVRAIARAVQRKNPSWTLSHCIAVAVNAIKYSAATGDSKLPGRQNEHPDVVEAHAAAVGDWEAKKALSGSKGGKSTKTAHSPTDVLALATPFDSALHPRAAAGGATGGQFVPVGQAKDAAGAKAQKNAKAAGNYKTAMTSKDPAAFIAGLSPADLKALTAYAYSAHSSDPNVVKLRIALAARMGKLGFDVKKFGALGGGITATKKSTTKKSTAKKSTSSKKSSSSSSKLTSPNKPGMVGVTPDQISDAQWNKLLAMGYTGDPNDGKEALYVPPAVLAKVKATKTAQEHTSGLALATPLSDSQSGSSITVNDDSKSSGDTTARAGKFPAAKRKAMAAKGQCLPDLSFPIEDPSDVKAAVKAESLTTKDKGSVRAHIVKNAQRVGALGSVPPHWAAKKTAQGK